MKQYLSLFKIRLINGLQYRAAAWAGVTTQFAWAGMTLLMFRAFYRSNAGAFPMTFPALSSYIWLQQAFLALYMFWLMDNDILESIRSGSVAYELCRPVDLYTMWFVKNMAIRLSSAALRCLPVLLVAVFLPRPFNMALPASPAAGLLFLLSMTLGFLVLVAFQMLFYIATFYMLSPLGLRILLSGIVDFFSGALIPLPFFPKGWQVVMELLPFASMQNTPFQIYNGYLTGTKIYTGLLLQAVWLVALAALGKVLMGRTLKKVTVQGG